MGPAGPCRWVPPHRHVGLRRRRKSLVLPGQPNLGLYSAQTAAGQAAVFIRTDSRSELACDAFRCGCCCTLLLYETREPYDQIFELWSLNWCGATETRTPDLLHAMQVRRPSCQRHHRPPPADLVHRRTRECLPVAGCWLSTWLSTIRLGTTCSNAVGETLTHAPAWRRHTDPLR
jgi:hypothetical protein